MQRTALLLVLGAWTLSSCTRDVSPSAPAGPGFELVDPDQRIDASLVNAHVYGSFAIPFEGGLQPIFSGPANFPGNPPDGPGTCVNGLWYNSRGKPTAGTLENPHPHCTTLGSALRVVLEPISVMAYHADRCASLCDALYFTDPKAADLNVLGAVKSRKDLTEVTEGTGVLVAYAIDAATLNAKNVRVGTITIELSQYDDLTANLFAECALDPDNAYPCISRVITATYTPLLVGGVGTPTTVSGFLWWAPASGPYNY